MFDYIVVGSGFAGSVIAERIASILDRKVLVVEKRNHLGGNCYDEKDENGIIVHRYGPHIFHTDDKEVFDYLSRFTEWEIYHHRVLAFVDGKKVPIPFNFNSMDALFPEELSKKLQQKLLEHYELGSKVPILDLMKNEDEIVKFLARYIYNKIFLNYTVKQWGIKPEEIDPSVTARVPVFIGRDDRYFNDKYQAVPKRGYSSIFNTMLHHPNIKLLMNTDFREIGTVENDGIYIFGKKFKGLLIYTGMIDRLINYKYGRLDYRSLRLEFINIAKEWFQEAPSVNYPNDYDFTRITEFKHIHPVKTEGTTILMEYPKASLQEEDTPYYPLFTDKSMKSYRYYAEHLQQIENLVLLGRLAEYKYYDMDDIVRRSLSIFEEKIKPFLPSSI